MVGSLANYEPDDDNTPCLTRSCPSVSTVLLAASLSTTSTISPSKSESQTTLSAAIYVLEDHRLRSPCFRLYVLYKLCWQQEAMPDTILHTPLSSIDDPVQHDQCSSPSFRREQRYSREQTALTKSLADSASGPSPQELQIRTLKQARDLLDAKAKETDERLAKVRVQLSEGDDRDKENREDLLRQRWVEEQRLSAVNREIAAITDQIEELQNRRMQQSGIEEAETSENKNVLRMSANFDLFLQKSPTKRPLHSHPRRPHSIISLPMEASSSRGVRSSASVSVRSKPPRFHARSRSLVEEKELGRLHHADVGTSRRNIASISSSSPGSSASVKRSEQSESLVPAVDEFTNSFSQRVITPLRLRERPPSIKQLKASSVQRLAPIPSASERPKEKSDYGKVTIISSATSRRQPGAPSAQVPDVQLPSYALSLLDGLSSTSGPSLSLREPDTSLLTFRQPVALAPLIELPSFTASMSQDSLPSTTFSPTPTVFAPPPIAPEDDRKPSLKKQRSLFTLRLPKRRPSIPRLSHTTSQVTLAAASSTTSVSDTSGDVPNNGYRPKELSKGLPSTRLYDLSQLGPAPDDLPHVSIGLSARQQNKPPATPKRKGLQAPFSALRDVKNRLANFGRR